MVLNLLPWLRIWEVHEASSSLVVLKQALVGLDKHLDRLLLASR